MEQRDQKGNFGHGAQEISRNLNGSKKVFEFCYGADVLGSEPGILPHGRPSHLSAPVQFPRPVSHILWYTGPRVVFDKLVSVTFKLLWGGLFLFEVSTLTVKPRKKQQWSVITMREGILCGNILCEFCNDKIERPSHSVYMLCDIREIPTQSISLFLAEQWQQIGEFRCRSFWKIFFLRIKTIEMGLEVILRETTTSLMNRAQFEQLRNEVFYSNKKGYHLRFGGLFTGRDLI